LYVRIFAAPPNADIEPEVQEQIVDGRISLKCTEKPPAVRSAPIK